MSTPKSLFASPGFLAREEAERIARVALSAARADATRVVVNGRSRANTRFAQNQVSTSGDNYNATITVRSVFGKRAASATTNRLDDASIAEVVARSEALARLAPEDPEAMPELEPQTYAPRPDPSQSTTPAPAERASAVKAVADAARAANLVATGYMESNVAGGAIANSKGLFAYQRSTQTAMSITVRTPDGTGSGWAGATYDSWQQLRARELGQVAIEKAVRSRSPVAVEPGRYTVILEPTAVANLLQLMFSEFGGGGASARRADEGRSFFSKQGGGNKIGMKIADERVTVVSDPNDPEARPGFFPGGFDTRVGFFTTEGLPTRRVVWVENGVLKNLQYDRFWAQKQGAQPTAPPSILHMTGGTASIADMVRSTQRGILVTRFWYLRQVDPRVILYTGLTRDGTFLIENGRITRAVKNFRFNDSPVFMLNNLEMIGRPVRVNGDEGGESELPVIVPPLKVRDFNFTSLSDAV